MSYYVQVYKGSDLNSPGLSGLAGSLVNLLNCCLVDGYGWSGMSITGITRSGSTATATVSTADGLKLATGMLVTVAGAVQTDYNGTFQITLATSTTFTYTVANSPTTPATGTITCDNFLRITSITAGGAGNLTATVTATDVNRTLVTGNWLTISGCTGTGAAQYNGTFQITVVGSSVFTYQMTADPTASASGSPVYCKAGLQWTRPFAAGTNSQVYRSQDTDSNMFYFQIIDNAATAGGAKEAQIYGAEIMEADQIVSSGRFPTTTQAASGLCLRKSTTASSVQRDWTLWGDAKTFTFAPITGDSTIFAWGCSFGHFISFKVGDLYNTHIAGSLIFNYSAGSLQHQGCFEMGWLVNITVTGAFYIARAGTQQGTAITSGLSGEATAAACAVIGAATNTMLSYPHLPDNAMYYAPLFIQDGIGILRGRMPGVYQNLSGSAGGNQYDRVVNIVGLPGTTITLVACLTITTGGYINVDTYGPWV